MVQRMWINQPSRKDGSNMFIIDSILLLEIWALSVALGVILSDLIPDPFLSQLSQS